MICLQRRFSQVNIYENDISPTLEAGAGEGGNNTPMVTQEKAVCIGNGQLQQLKMSDKVGALNCMHDQQAVLAFDRAAFNQGKNAQYDFSIQENIAQPLVARGPGGVLTQSEHYVQEIIKE